MQFTIEQIAQATGGQLFVKDEAQKKLCVENVDFDSRKVAAGGVFIAAPGERVDGHKFIGQVFGNGATLVVTEKTPEQIATEHGVPVDSWGNYLLVPDSYEALKKMATAYRDTLQIPVVGITGSVGKTSTKEFISGVLSRKWNVLKTQGNYNNEIGVPYTLLSIRPEHEVAVIEMGISDFGEMGRLTRMAKPNVAVITNIGQCHLENLKTRDGILQAKTEIFEGLQEDGLVCLYGEDDKLCTVSDVKGKAPFFFGDGGNAKDCVYTSDVETLGLEGSRAILHFASDVRGFKNLPEKMEISVPLPGEHMVRNAAAAACVAALLGLNATEIQEGIAQMQPIDGRNRILKSGSYLIIDDCYNANPVSMKSSVDLLQMSKGIRPTAAILGDMFELGEDSDAMHSGVGAYAVEKEVNYLFCVGENARYMYEGAKQVLESKIEGSFHTQIFYFADKNELFAALQKDAEQNPCCGRKILPENSAVLVKASHGMHFPEVVDFLEQIAVKA